MIIMIYTIIGTVPSGKNNTTEGNTRRMGYYWKFAAWLYNRENKTKI